MSEPIQSISQGNYILQGTVATSAGVVGDGSTQNPLRADETVLFEHTTTGNVASCTLSENVSAFERFKIFTTTVAGSSQVVNEFQSSTNNETYDVCCPGGNNQPVIRFVQFTVNGTSVSSTRCASIFFNSYAGSPTYRFNNSDDLKFIHKVVGINRKNNA